MPQLSKNETTYKFSLQEVRELLAKELKIPVQAVSVTYNMKREEEYGFAYSVIESISTVVDHTKITNTAA